MPHTDRVHTPDTRLTGPGQRELSRRGVLLAAPVGLLALATGSVGASLLAPVGHAGAQVLEDARSISRSLFGSPEVRAALADAVTPIVGRSTVIAVSVLDRRTGTRWDHRGDSLVQTGSVAKVLVTLAALRKAREAGTSLSARQLEQVRLAITRSDNASADALYSYIGGHTAVARLAKDLGMEATASAARVPHWGNTLTTADDLVVLMTALAGGTPVLNAKDRAVVLGHMAQVVDGQRWGVGTVRTSTVKIHVKNGWMRVDNPWVINSVGDVTGAGRDYVLAILQRAQPDEDSGMDRASWIGRAVFNALAP
jgi:beta-lactamase class A